MSNYVPLSIVHHRRTEEDEEDLDYVFNYEEMRDFIRSRDDDLEVMIPLIDDPDLIDLIREYLEKHSAWSLEKAMTDYVVKHLNLFRDWRGED